MGVTAKASMVALGTIAFCVAACAAQPSTPSVGVADADVDLTLVMTEFAFDPPAGTVEPGTVALSVSNAGVTDHELRIYAGETLVGESGRVAPSSRGSVIVELEPGSYRVVCQLPGHEAAGMVGTLTVGT